MNGPSQDQIEYGNLKGEVTVLRELLRFLYARELALNPEATNDLMTAAFNAARKVNEPLSPARISVDYAINKLTEDLGYR